jgi:hypothetical protein
LYLYCVAFYSCQIMRIKVLKKKKKYGGKLIWK